MRAVRRERVLAPGEIANRRAARAKKFLTSIPPTVAWRLRIQPLREHRRRCHFRWRRR